MKHPAGGWFMRGFALFIKAIGLVLWAVFATYTLAGLIILSPIITLAMLINHRKRHGNHEHRKP